MIKETRANTYTLSTHRMVDCLKESLEDSTLDGTIKLVRQAAVNEIESTKHVARRYAQRGLDGELDRMEIFHPPKDPFHQLEVEGTLTLYVDEDGEIFMRFKPYKRWQER